MKRICLFVLLLSLIASFSAYAQVEITLQEIYDANQTEALLKNHQSVYVREEMDGEFWSEKYLTKDYLYSFIPSEESDWVEFITDDAYYCYLDDDCVRYVSITPDGVSDFASLRAARSALFSLGADPAEEIIESVSEKDGRITVTSVLNQEKLFEDAGEFGVTAGKFEYVVDAKTREIISLISDYTYDDGTAFNVVTEATYDAEVPEMINVFLEYDNQTENLRNVTIVSNPGTEKEESQSIQAPKGLIIGLYYEEDDHVFEVYADAACTELYDPYADTDSDLTIYVKWSNT